MPSRKGLRRLHSFLERQDGGELGPCERDFDMPSPRIDVEHDIYLGLNATVSPSIRNPSTTRVGTAHCSYLCLSSNGSCKWRTNSSENV